MDQFLSIDHHSVRLERVLMKHLVFLFANSEPFLVAFVVLQLLDDLVLFVFSAHVLVLDHYSIEFALVDQAVVLAVSDLTLGARL